jgi:hypothetical protein
MQTKLWGIITGGVLCNTVASKEIWGLCRREILYKSVSHVYSRNYRIFLYLICTIFTVLEGWKIGCGLDSQLRPGFWKNYRAAVRAVRTIQYNYLLFYLLLTIIIDYSSDLPTSLITESSVLPTQSLSSIFNIFLQCNVIFRSVQSIAYAPLILSYRSPTPQLNP